MNPLRDEKLTEQIIRCIIHVHKTLGPGFLESIYKCAVLVELRKQNLRTEVEKEIAIYYDNLEVGRHRLDLLVEGRIILELKTVEAFSKAHYAQVRAYLKASGLQTALLIKFSDIRADFRRIEVP